MIGDALLNLVHLIFAAMTGLLPVAGVFALHIPEGWIYGYSFLNTFLPMSELVAVALVLVQLRILVWGFRLIYTIKNIIPVIG